jgi:hypothetical protein
MNRHPLTEDFRMYFNNTYVFSMSNGEPQAMFVTGTTRLGNDTQLEGVGLLGDVYNARGLVAEGATWAASTIETLRPPSGYYDLRGDGRRRSYVTFQVANRTNRKGVDPRTLLINNRQAHINGSSMARLYAQALEMNSRPGYRDFYRNPEGVVFYKGFEVGTMEEGQPFEANQENKSRESMLWRLLQAS